MHVIFKGEAVLNQVIRNAKVGGRIINIYTVYRLSLKTASSSNALKNCLFGAIKVTNTAISDSEIQIFPICYWF